MSRPVPGLRAARSSAGFTQQRLAEAAGCSMSTVTFAERGAVVSEEMAQRLADALGVTVADIAAEGAR